MADLTVSDAEELELIRQHRERTAAAERLADAWTQVFAELSEAAEKDLAPGARPVSSSSSEPKRPDGTKATRSTISSTAS